MTNRPAWANYHPKHDSKPRRYRRFLAGYVALSMVESASSAVGTACPPLEPRRPLHEIREQRNPPWVQGHDL